MPWSVILSIMVLGGRRHPPSLLSLREWRDSEEERRRKLEADRDRRNHLTIQRRGCATVLRHLNAEEKSEQLSHPMLGLRDAGHLVVIDTEDRLAAFKKRNTIIFLSHQWLAWGVPDPENIHHSAMKAAITKVSANSIAQEHRGMQLAAIAALPMYGEWRAQTYNMRGWCRAEMLSKVLGSGLQNFYILTGEGDEVEPVTADSNVLKAGMTTCDKEALMPAILGLYSKVLKSTRSSSH
eukprot:gene22824-9331_t